MVSDPTTEASGNAAAAPINAPFRFRAARAAVFQLEGPDRFTARGSVSSPLVTNLNPDHLRVFAAFGEPTTLARAQEELYDWYEPEEVQRLGDELLENDLLHVVGLDRCLADGFGKVDAHFPMVADVARVDGYAAAIYRHVRGKDVAELGCGSGILTVLAALAGARSVWAVEETDIIEAARGLVAANAPHVPISLVRGEACDHEPPRTVDVLVHEIFGLDPFDEGVLGAIADARARWLKPGGRLLPTGFSVWAMALDEPAEGPLPAGVRLTALEDRWSIDLGPLRELATDGLFVHPSPLYAEPPDRERITAPTKLFYVDLTDPQVPSVLSCQLPVRTDGAVSRIITWFDIQLDETLVLSTGPLGPHTHWGWQLHERLESLPVKAGQTLHLEVMVDIEDTGESLRVRSLRAE